MKAEGGRRKAEALVSPAGQAIGGPSGRTRYSVLSTQYSVVGTRHSAFSIQHSAFSIPFRLPPSAFPRRAGISLLEVLIAIFVLSIGLLGVAALIPVGRFEIVEAGKADRSGACGHAALHEIKIRRMLDYELWTPTSTPPTWWAAVTKPRSSPPTVPYMGPFAIDPLGVASGLAGPLGGSGGLIPRITLKSATGAALTYPQAEQVFRWHDELLFDGTTYSDERPRRIVKDKDGKLGVYPPWPSDPPPAEPVQPLADGNYSWLVTVTPAAVEADLPVAEKTVYSVSVAVCYKRDFSADGEQTAGVKKLPGGGSVQLNQVIGVKPNEWVMLCGGGHCKWYRVVFDSELLVNASTGDPDPNGIPVTALSLAGPDCPVGWMIDSDGDGLLDVQAVVIDSVVAVYTATVELDRSPQWNK